MASATINKITCRYGCRRQVTYVILSVDDWHFGIDHSKISGIVRLFILQLSRKNIIKPVFLYLILGVIPVMMNACIGSEATVSYFPVQLEKQYLYPAALAEGKLVLDNGCLLLKNTFTGDEVLLWPPGFSYRVEGKKVKVIDENGELVAITGNRIKVGGGELLVEMVEKLTGELPPDDCRGPFWLVWTVSPVLND